MSGIDIEQLDFESIRPGEARWDTPEHEHEWHLANNILGPPFAECLCGASAALHLEGSE